MVSVLHYGGLLILTDLLNLRVAKGVALTLLTLGNSKNDEVVGGKWVRHDLAKECNADF